MLSVFSLAATSAMTGILWLVQLVHYPMFDGLNESSFRNWHEFHSRRISYIVAPLMIFDLGMAFALSYWLRSPLSYVATGLTVLVWLLTFFVSVPLHDKLGSNGEVVGNVKAQLIARLVLTNWPRTIAYSLKLALSILLLL